jgi:hypothetical protein
MELTSLGHPPNGTMWTMGWSYTHLALFGPDQAKVLAALTGRKASVSPTVNSFTLVADEEFESHDGKRIAAFSAALSKKLGCVAMIVSEFDDDVLCYQLIESGEVLDEYNSEPDYFDFAGEHIPPRAPQGGDADRLCAALKRTDACEQVGSVLRRQDVALPAPERHKELAPALGMPPFSVGFDYGALQSGELPEGLSEFDVIFTATEPG